MTPLLCIHLAVFIWGFTGILGRSIQLNEISLVFWRLFITVVSLWAGRYMLMGYIRSKAPYLLETQSGVSAKVKILSREFFWIMLPGMILGLHWVCFYGSIKHANISVALTCLGTSALMASILEPIFFGRRIKMSETILGMLVILGMAIIYYTHVQFSVGVWYGLLAALLTVIVSILNKNLVTKYSPIQMIGFQMFGAFLSVSICFPLYAAAFDKTFEFPSGIDLLYLFVLSWLCTIITFFLWMMALRKISAFTSNVLLALEPIYGIILAFLLYQEYKDVSGYFYLGFLIIALAVGLHKA